MLLMPRPSVLFVADPKFGERELEENSEGYDLLPWEKVAEVDRKKRREEGKNRMMAR